MNHNNCGFDCDLPPFDKCCYAIAPHALPIVEIMNFSICPGEYRISCRRLASWRQGLWTRRVLPLIIEAEFESAGMGLGVFTEITAVIELQVKTVIVDDGHTGLDHSEDVVVIAGDPERSDACWRTNKAGGDRGLIAAKEGDACTQERSDCGAGGLLDISAEFNRRRCCKYPLTGACQIEAKGPGAGLGQGTRMDIIGREIDHRADIMGVADEAVGKARVDADLAYILFAQCGRREAWQHDKPCHIEAAIAGSKDGR